MDEQNRVSIFREFFAEILLAGIILLVLCAYIYVRDQVLAGALTTLIGVFGGILQGRRSKQAQQTINAPIDNAAISIDPAQGSTTAQG